MILNNIILFYILSALINGLVATILGFIVYFKGKKEFVNKIFALFCADIAVWSYSYFVWLLLKDKNLILLNHRIFLMGASIFIAILFFHSILAFINKIKEYKKLLILGYIIFFFFLFVDYFTPFLVKNVQRELFFEFWPKAGILLTPFIVVWYFYIFMAIHILYKEIKKIGISKLNVDISYKNQLKYILSGAIIGFVGAVSNYFLWYSIMIPPVTNFLVSIGIMIIIFGVLKHHLFNIKILISELLVFFIWIFIIARMAISSSYQDFFINAILAVLVFCVGIFLIHSVSREIELNKKLLDETQKNLEFEQRLKDTYAKIAGHEIKEKYFKEKN